MDVMLLRAFQTQIAFQCRVIVLAANELNAALFTGDTTRIWVAIQNLLTGAANISKALWGQSGKFAAERADLRASIQIDDTSALRSVAMRNNFEHFDERLDRWWEKSSNRSYIDMNVGPLGAIVGAEDIDTFRWFDPTTSEVIFWGRHFNINEVLAETQRMLPIVTAAVAMHHWQPPSSEGSGQPHQPS
jgi:hypothetical protein